MHLREVVKSWILCCKLAAYLLRMVLKNVLTLSPSSGRSRNLERGFSLAPENFKVATPTSGYVNSFMTLLVASCSK